MTFKGRESNITEIRQQLNVDFALEGSIRHDGDMVRVTAQLVDTETQTRLWGGNFDYPIRGWLELHAFLGLMPSAMAYREAERSATRALELDPDNGDAQAVLGWVQFVYRWNWTESERMMRKAVENGYWKALTAVKEDAFARYPDSFSWRYAVVMSKIGAPDAAMDMLERGYHQRRAAMVFLPAYRLQALYSEPRFQNLVKRMNLQEVASFSPPY